MKKYYIWVEIEEYDSETDEFENVSEPCRIQEPFPSREDAVDYIEGTMAIDGTVD